MKNGLLNNYIDHITEFWLVVISSVHHFDVADGEHNRIE